MRGYIKSFLANKILFAYTAIMIFGIVNLILNLDDIFAVCLLVFETVLLFFVFYHMIGATHETYVKTKNLLSQKGEDCTRLIKPTQYCNRQGYELALKEYKKSKT